MNLSDLEPYVAPYVGNCPRGTMRRHLLLAAIEFCERGRAQREQLPAIVGDGATVAHVAPIDDQVEIAWLEKVVTRGGAAQRAEPEHKVVDASYGRMLMNEEEDQRIAWTDNRRTVSVWPRVANGARIEVLVCLKPALTAWTISDALGAHYGQSIAAGAIASLTRMPRVDWSAPELASSYRAEFLDAAQSALIAHSLGHGGTAQKPPVRTY